MGAMGEGRRVGERKGGEQRNMYSLIKSTKKEKRGRKRILAIYT